VTSFEEITRWLVYDQRLSVRQQPRQDAL